ncbi:MAG: DUF4177 domain-containing protein [Oscillospiraceae bacterium]|nr:DUF4177 domain-containing protein [Oscillospiraceae bacterium]
MKKYEYRFVEVPRRKGVQVRTGDTFEECRQVIMSEAEEGWRLKQIVTPFDEKTGMFIPYCYQIIFEREV